MASGKLSGIVSPRVVGEVDRGLQLPAGKGEYLGGAGDGLQPMWLHEYLLLSVLEFGAAGRCT